MRKLSSTWAPSLSRELVTLCEFQANRTVALCLTGLCVSLAQLSQVEEQTLLCEPLRGTTKSSGEKKHDKFRLTWRNGCREAGFSCDSGIC